MMPNQDEPKSLLSNLRQHHIVHVFNPLSEPFTWPMARSVVEADPRYIDQDMQRMNMRNDSHPTMKHVSQPVTLPAGVTWKIPGDVAQVVVKHLIDEVMYKEGHKKTGDPALRKEYEERVILNIDDLRAKLTTQSLNEQLNDQISAMNREETVKEVKHEEQPFPDVQTSRSVAGGSGGLAGTKQAPEGGKQDTPAAPAVSSSKR